MAVVGGHGPALSSSKDAAGPVHFRAWGILEAKLSDTCPPYDPRQTGKKSRRPHISDGPECKQSRTADLHAASSAGLATARLPWLSKHRLVRDPSGSAGKTPDVRRRGSGRCL